MKRITLWTIAMTVAMGLVLPVAAQVKRLPRKEESAADKAASTSAAHLAILAKQLPAALAQLNSPDERQQAKSEKQLDALAKESADLAKLLPESKDQLHARNLEIQVYSALAHRARVGRQEREASYRVGQLRTAALGARDISAPNAQMIGEFWLLQADLFDINRSSNDTNVRQRRAMERLERFLNAQDEASKRKWKAKTEAQPGSLDAVAEKLGSDMNTQVALALLTFYDQRGISDRAQVLSKKVSEFDDLTEPQKQQVDQIAAGTDVVGQHFQANLKLSHGKIWSSEKHQGKVVLVNFYADWFVPSLKSHERVKAIAASLQVRGVSLLSVQMPNNNELLALAGAIAPGAGQGQGSAVRSASPSPKPAKPAPDAGADLAPIRRKAKPWPVYQEGPGQVSLTRMFAVQSLPRFVLIDTKGKVHAVASSLAILEQLDSILPKPEAKKEVSP